MKRLKKEKHLLWIASKFIEKICDPRYAKEHYQSFMRKNIHKIEWYKKEWKFFKRKRNIKTKTKREHALEGFANICIVKISNCFYPELQLKDTESAIKSKLIELLT